MEKGSFHTPRPEPVASPTLALDESVKKIPLPNQLPKGIDISELPQAALRSATLESLISQNEDLMARLSVSLRKTAEYEQRVAELEAQNKEFRHKFVTLKEQFLILQEKDRLYSGRAAQTQDESLRLKAQIERLEKSYTDVFVQAQAFQRRLVRLERYRARVRKAATGIQARAKAAGSAEQIKKDHQIERMQLVNAYEAKIADVRAEIESLRPKAQERDRIYEERVQIENQMVLERRRHEMQTHDFEQRQELLEGENSALRVQVKELLVDREDARLELDRLREEVPQLRDHKQNLIEQVESLQTLWNQKQREWELLSEKNRSLQKLNQSISLTLNQQRKEIHGLKNELEQERFDSAEKIKTLLAELEMLRRT